MRIGIVTFCNAYNLGGALQAYSLWKCLEELGNDSELIDYHCPAIDAMHRLRPVFRTGIRMKSRIYNLVYNAVFFPRRIRYQRFQKYAKRSKPYNREIIGQTNGKYDVFVTGSDQVFNLKLTGGDTTYFLDFVETGIKMAYAASLGTFLSEKKGQYQQLLGTFACLSVREKSAAVLLEEEMGIRADVMPDPVFLHTGKEWVKLLGIRVRNQTEKYVLVYALFEKKELYQLANAVAQKNGFKVIVVTKALRPLGRADRYLRNTGPKEFVELVANADYIVTNSFHGTAFSLIFEKQFTAVLPPVAPERIVDLLTDLDICDRTVLESDRILHDTINYANILPKMKRLKEHAVQWLTRYTEGNCYKL